MNTSPERPAAFMVSAVAGGLGVVLILIAVLTGTAGFYWAGFVMGVISLVSALVWRSELVSAWRAKRR